ncbi:MAG: hypothetical protein E6H09_21530 [Bacteroidetes bacterium]|jgi:hypothetical protein|nr:MAG: hypothetical protein E6H09_21530 [Bacteroidota bacterium]
MKTLILFFFLACIVGIIQAADNRYSSCHGSISFSFSDTLTDTLTGKYYVLFRSEQRIRAFDRQHKGLWETDPWKCLELSGILKYSNQSRTADSISINQITFGKTIYMDGKEAVMIYFSQRIVGAIDKKSGHCEILGQN